MQTFNKQVRGSKPRPPKKKPLQETYLQYCILSEDDVSIDIDGEVITGHIVDADQFTILFHQDGSMFPILLYKAALTSVSVFPMRSEEDIHGDKANKELAINMKNVSNGLINNALKALK